MIPLSMFFPYRSREGVVESPKTVKYFQNALVSMQGRTSQAVLERLVTGKRCDEERCYELAVWSVTFNDVTSHWCPKHTRMKMRDPNQWGDFLKTKARGSQTRI